MPNRYEVWPFHGRAANLSIVEIKKQGRRYRVQLDGQEKPAWKNDDEIEISAEEGSGKADENKAAAASARKSSGSWRQGNLGACGARHLGIVCRAVLHSHMIASPSCLHPIEVKEDGETIENRGRECE